MLRIIGGGLLLFVAILVHASSALHEPLFYTQALSNARIFDRLGQDLLPAIAAERVRETWPNAADSAVEETAHVTRALLTPQWLEARTETLLASLRAWLVGRSDRWRVVIPVADRLEVAAATLQERAEVSTLRMLAWERMLELVVDDISALSTGATGLPFNLTTDRAVWDRAVHTIAEQDWVLDQLLSSVDATVAWLIGDSETLAIHISLNDRQAAVASALEGLVNASDIEAFLDREIKKRIAERLQNQTLVHSAPVSLDREELIECLVGLLSTEFVRARKADIVRILVRWIAGKSETLTLSVPMGPIKALATDKVTATIRDKVLAVIDEKPPCSAGQMARILGGGTDPLSCRPRGSARTAFTLLLAGYVRDRVAKVVDDNVSDEFVRHEHDVRAEIAADAWKMALTARRWMRKGLDLDEAALRRMLGGRVDLVDRVLEVTRHGFTVTDEDLPLEALGWTREGLATELAPLRTLLAWCAGLHWPLVALSVAVLLGLALVSRQRGARLWEPGLASTLGGALALLTAALLDRWIVGATEHIRELAASASSTDLAGALLTAAPHAIDTARTQALRGLTQPATVAVLAGAGLALVGLLRQRRARMDSK